VNRKIIKGRHNKNRIGIMKKTFSFAVKPAACLMRHLFRGAVVVAALAAAGLYAAPTVTTLAGGVSGPTGYKDTNSLFALFKTPIGIAVDQGNDNLYVADRDNNAVRLLDLVGGQTYTFATNQVNKPVGVVLDGDDNVYVLNRGTGTTVSTNGTVLEFDYYGYLIATNASNLTNAAAIAIDPAGNLYVTERTNLLVRLTTTNPVPVATVTIPNAFLQGISVMANGMIAACDYNRNGIYTIDPNTGIVTTNAGFNGQGDGTGIENRGVFNSKAQFFQPYGVAASGDGTLIVTDFGNDRVKVVTASGITTNFYGVASNVWISPFPGWRDGTVSIPDLKGGVSSRCPAGVVLSPDGTTVYTTEDFYSIIRQVTGASFKAQPPLPPTAPLGLTATVVTNGNNIVSVQLTWFPIAGEGVTNYLVERSPSTGGPYSTIVASTTGTTASDTNVAPGNTYFYVVQAANAGGLGEDSAEASVTISTLPPATPTIGWFDYEFNTTNILAGSVFHPISGQFTAVNDLSFTVNANVPTGDTTLFAAGPTPLGTNVSFSGAFTYGGDGQSVGSQKPLPITTTSDLTIQAKNQNPTGQNSATASVEIFFVAGIPGIIGTNAAQFTLTDPTTNVVYYYTIDGTDPTNAPASQQLISTNGMPVVVSLNISSNFLFEVRAERPGYATSLIASNLFLAQNFNANSLTWGFASGEASSEFIASPGQSFYAPVTLTTLPSTVMYSLQFNMVETNLGPDPVPNGDYGFNSMLKEPGTLPNTTGIVFFPIPPLEFIGGSQNPPPGSQIVTYNGTNFINLEVSNTNLDELAVGWFEMIGKTNLYDTSSQNLISYSQAYISMYPASNPNHVIVGGYFFQVPTNAQPGEQYQIQLGRASAENDGLGGDNSAVTIVTPTTGSLTSGAINSIKVVTVGQARYLAGDVYPFHWFNAGDFGNGDLITYGNVDVESVFRAAIYSFNVPPTNSDFYDAMDSSGGNGTLTSAGYWIPTTTLSGSGLNPLFNVNNSTTINQMPFGNGVLDVSDVYVTFLRSEFPNLTWFQRFYTNDTVNGYFGRAAYSITTQTNVNSSLAKRSLNDNAQGSQTPTSITNTPLVRFVAGDYLASAGQTLSIPVTANVFGQNPLRMLMFNVSVVPLDGSPAITTPLSFTPSAPFSNPNEYNAPSQGSGTEDNSQGNFAAAFLPVHFPIDTGAAVTGSNVVGYLTVVIPASATASSAYAIYFNHASASPNGLVSFPKTTYTGLITLSSRTNSTYGDSIPDSWRLRYFGTVYNELSVSNADADGTGMNNLQKYVAGLNPTDPTSVLNEGMDQPMAQNKQDFVLYWPSVTGKTYVIQRSPTLFPPQWTSVSTNIGDGTYMEIHDANGSGNGYYRVSAQ
jgi:sugar lactone lactonase YvrE